MEIDDIIDETVDNSSKHCDFDKMTPQRLKDIIKEILKTRSTPAYAANLLVNLKRYYQEEKYLDKITYMIELNTDGWTHQDKLKFLNWYSKHLRRIAGKR